MELRQLHYFHTIAEEEHFGRASARLRIAQPALSRQMKLLETELGVDLFERLPRGVRLTAAGRVFQAECRQVLTHLGRAVSAARAAAAGQMGALRLGFIEVAAWKGLIPEAIRQFRTDFPAVDLGLSAMSSADQMAAVTDGRLDAGFLYNAASDPAMETLVLARHEVMVAVPASHRLADAAQVSLADLRDDSFVGFRRAVSPRFHDDLTAAFAINHFTPRIIAEMTGEADMLALVNAGVGLAFVNSCQRWRPPLSVRFLALTDLAVSLELSLIWRRDNGSPTLARFIDIAAGKVG
jgi:DNA-binding transcriptional LysR family regulator